MESSRNKRKTREGVVVKDKMDKTIVVKISRLAKHKEYGRVMHMANTFKVHDEKNEAKIGDKVRIMETRRLSKHKRWRLMEIVK